MPDREKHLFDYVQALKECRYSGAKYVGVFEDDVLASDGWFLRMKKGLEEVERRTEGDARKGCKCFSILHIYKLLIKNVSLLSSIILYRRLIGME